jgi:hypothetical protein
VECSIRRTQAERDHFARADTAPANVSPPPDRRNQTTISRRILALRALGTPRAFGEGFDRR